MNEVKSNPLESLIGCELSSVEFVRDYIQLHFDGPYLTLITNPMVQIGDIFYKWGQLGYRDAICDCINAKVSTAFISEGKELHLDFNQGTVITVSLKPKDYTGAEAVIFNNASEKWWVW